MHLDNPRNDSDVLDRIKTRKVTLPTFLLTVACAPDEPGAVERVFDPICGTGTTRYSFRPSVEPQLNSSTQIARNQFPIILNSALQPWDPANLYLLDRLRSPRAPHSSTLHGIADDLCAFLAFLENKSIQYDAFPQNKLHRPTYRFHGYLKTAVFESQIALSTAQRRMAAVIGFYRWLIAQRLLQPAFAPWQEKGLQIAFKDARGFAMSRSVITTDVAIKMPTQADPYADHINDGGRLRPLSSDEQLWLIKALAAADNIEMLLIHLLMLTSGARAQTALTFQVSSIKHIPADASDIRIPVGPGTGIDTKKDKRMVLHVPAWLVARLQLYAASERAAQRRSKLPPGSTAERYLFLTQQGSPYYANRQDQMAFDPAAVSHHQKNAQTVRMFIRERVIPYVRTHFDANFGYRIHDLRATYGMNLADTLLGRVERKEITLSQAKAFIMVRMGHDQGETTDRYLDYRKLHALAVQATEDHEQHLRKLIDRAWGH